MSGGAILITMIVSIFTTVMVEIILCLWIQERNGQQEGEKLDEMQQRFDAYWAEWYARNGRSD